MKKYIIKLTKSEVKHLDEAHRKACFVIGRIMTQIEYQDKYQDKLSKGKDETNGGKE